MKLLFVGDVSLGEHYFSFGHGPRSLIESGEDIFSDVKDVLKNHDLVIGNLEGPISDINYDPDDPHKRVFRGPPRSANILFESGFNVINIANNHFAQHGFDAGKESIALLEKEGILVIGKAESPISYIYHNGETVALIGCSFIPDNTDPNQTLYFSPSENVLLRTVEEASQNAKLTIVYPHWGVESRLIESDEQVNLSEKLIAHGASIVIGHHPHTLQPVLVHEDHIIAYSLGNFVFDLPWCKMNRESGMLCIDTDMNKFTNVKLIRCSINRHGKPRLLNRHIILKNGRNIISELENLKNDFSSLKKLNYLLLNLFKGSTRAKLRFLAWKIKQKLT